MKTELSNEERYIIPSTIVLRGTTSEKEIQAFQVNTRYIIIYDS